MEYLITFRSITPAQRGEQTLLRKGIDCAIQRTPRWMEEKGCGYSLHVKSKNIYDVTATLRAGGIAYRKVYLQRNNGKPEELEL